MAEPRIICIGRATQDVFLSGSAITAKRDVRTKDYVEQFPLGAKIEIDNVHFDTGGGGANAAVTFARSGFQASFVGKIGRDPAGREVLRVLHLEGVSGGQVVFDKSLATGYSVLLVATNGERTILNYPGASGALTAKDIAFRRLEADWLYISSLGGNIDLLTKILKHANNHGISVALNPGGDEIEQAAKLKALLPLVTVLLANREEYERIFGAGEPSELLGKAAGMVEYAILTDGPKGSWAANDGKMYKTGQYKNVKVVDRTGAGDAFGSGFVAAIARGDSIEFALTLASANSTGVVEKIGAKAGILHASAQKRLKKMKIEVSKL